MILPYPPGVPLLMPGEMITAKSRAVLDFLLMLCSVGQRYPGFETDIHASQYRSNCQFAVLDVPSVTVRMSCSPIRVASEELSLAAPKSISRGRPSRVIRMTQSFRKNSVSFNNNGR